MVTPLGCGVETDLVASARRQERRAAASPSFDVDDLPAQIACDIPRGDGSDGTFNPDQWMEPKEQRKVDDFIVFAMAAATQALQRCRLAARELRGPDRDRRSDRLGHRRPRRHRRRLDHAAREGPAAHLAVLHPRPADQSRLRLCLDRARPQGTEPCGRHGLLDRRARHRRRVAPDRARRCRRDGRRRHRIAGQPAVARRLRRLPGAVDRLQRHARRRPRVPMTGTATASSWARAPASSCSRNSSMPRRAARRSTPR